MSRLGTASVQWHEWTVCTFQLRCMIWTPVPSNNENRKNIAVAVYSLVSVSPSPPDLQKNIESV